MTSGIEEEERLVVGCLVTIDPASPGEGINASLIGAGSYRLHDKGPHILISLASPREGVVWREASLLLRGCGKVVRVSHFDVAPIPSWWR